MKFVWTVLLVILAAGSASAEVVLEPVDYKQGNTALRGWVAYDNAVQGKRPGVLIVHEWWGLTEYPKMRARKLAAEGYVAFALDMYGDGKTTEHPAEAGEWAQAIGANQKMARERFIAGYEQLAAHKFCDPDKIAAIGYCFGGSVVVMMALAGVDLDAVISFHGSFPGDVPTGNVGASILMCSGAEDVWVTDESVETFQRNMTDAGIDFEINIYGRAKHSFTNPGASERGIDNLAYSPDADRRSWRAALGFLKDAFE